MGDHHINDNGKHVRDIDARLRKLADAFGDAGSSDDFDELFLIIHRPGFTTPQQLAMMFSLIEATERSLNTALQLRGAIVEGARVIDETSALAV
ncbi:MAG TPA: hypothetical protein VMG74_09200 [Gaiellaceae bacterium]|nr:hypothetical protein [Solirubrobacteraceae bacterium]HTS73876.1 hypothetical protein [Gaiellaceae bacterium]